MKAYILTQEDAFYIPKLLGKFLSHLPANCEIAGAAILKGEIAAKNAISYLKFLGPTAFTQQVTLYGAYRVMDVADRAFPGTRSYSVAGVLRKAEIPIHRPADINAPSFHDLLRELDVSLLVSIACPQIVRRALLDLPEHGCINIHGALLPKYRGRMPSFWVLANGETKTGVTVHYMNEKLDDGPIIVQKEVPIEPSDTLHSLVLKSKVGYGALALVEAVDRIASGTVELQPNDAASGTYYSAPTEQAVQAFRQKGRKFR